MTNEEMLKAARLAVLNYTNEHAKEWEIDPIRLKDVFIVWFCKTLQNWKALVSTTAPNQMYYEITYNGDQREMYLDAYNKTENVKLSVWKSDKDDEMRLSRKG